VVLKAYFDAGNQADSSQYDVLSLAATAGTVKEWLPFEKAWKRNLKKHKADFLHTTDAVSRKGIYEGWTVNQRDKFLIDCVKIAGQHGARAKIGGVPGRYGLFTFVTSIVLKDFVAAQGTIPDAPHNANDACLRETGAEILLWSSNQAACDQCHFFFDQGEPFYGHLTQLMQSKKAMKDAFLLQRITYRTEADMRGVPALQLADLYAWCVSHRLAEWQPKWLVRLLKNHWSGVWLDKTNLHELKLDQIALSRTWNLPKRKATR
jgi:hypothetical protein